MEFLNGLNKEQLATVTAGEGPMLIIAGAGSGKTRVLVSRCAYLINEKCIYPSNILAVTFTNKAAREMRERLTQTTGFNVDRMWLGTFHSVCVRILRRESEALNFGRNFVIYDDHDSESLLKKIAAQMELDEKKFAPRILSGVISKAKNSLHDAAYLSRVAGNEWERQTAAVYSRYQRLLRENNALDFDDLITETVLLFQENPQALQQYRERFKYIFVDEYQDINHTQYMLVKLLAGDNGNVCVVGDPDQSIYGWRGADMSNILGFEKDFPDCAVFSLTQNYRSTQNILSAANSVIANNLERKPKELWSDKGAGDRITLHTVENDRDEAYYVLSKINELMLAGYNYSDCVILYRTNSQTRAFEDACIKNRVPYRIIGSMKFYERKEVKDSLAYLKIIANPADGVSLGRVYNEPKRGIGKASWEKLEEFAMTRGCCLYDALASLDESSDSPISRAAVLKLKHLYKMLERLRAFAGVGITTQSYGENVSLEQLLRKIWEETGYLEMLKLDPDGEQRLENLNELCNLAADFDRQFAQGELDEEETPLSAFLARIALATDLDDWSADENYLTLMTLHAAKGLEFPIVFIVAMEENIFPHSRAQADDDELEEERRLCYVGMTRAEEKLFLLRALRRLSWGRIVNNPLSRFLREIPKELLKETGAPVRNAGFESSFAGNYGGGANAAGLKNNGRLNLFTGKPEADVAKKPAATEPVQLGDRVVHAKFGLGVVVSASGEGDTLQVGIAFPDQGIKQLLWRYAPVKKA